MASSDQKLEIFVHEMSEFITQLSEVFPECTMTKIGKTSYDSVFPSTRDGYVTKQNHDMALNMITEWNEQISPYYDMIVSKDDRFFAIPHPMNTVCGMIDIGKKWTPSLHPETKLSIWAYMEEFCNLAKEIAPSSLIVKKTALPLESQISPKVQSYFINKILDAVRNREQKGLDVEELSMEDLPSLVSTVVQNLDDEGLQLIENEMKTLDIQSLISQIPNFSSVMEQSMRMLM